MFPDDVAWEQAEEISDKWLLRSLKRDVKVPIADFILKHNRGNASEFAILKKGSYNISLRMKYQNSSTIIRFSQPGAVFFPEEKVMNEVAVMRFLADQTSIPVPFILHSGTKKESPLELGPFIMMDYIAHETKMYDALITPGCPIEERGILDPNIDEDRLEMLYGQLSGDLPRRKLPDTTFTTTSSYLEALADLNMEHLVYQRNDAVKTADDCQQKPELWPKGIDDWTNTYDNRLKTFLKAMKDREDTAIHQGLLKEHDRLSGRMQKSWDSGDFWITYAALHSFAFDIIYWKMIDPRFFEPTERPEEAWKERLNLLDDKEKDKMEELVARKLKEKEVRILAWDPDEYTAAFHQQLKAQMAEGSEEDREDTGGAQNGGK
ncbi:hypothetical protein Plec18170_006864 [Paecilomyces lecythidis]